MDNSKTSGRALARSVCQTATRFLEVTGTGEVLLLQWSLEPQYFRLLVGPRDVRRMNRDRKSYQGNKMA
jgi:hypothetical protein